MSVRLVDGGGGGGPLRIGGVEVHVVREDEALPFGVDVIVVEQDTWLALAPPRDVLPESAARDVVRTMTRAHDVDALPLGTVHFVRVSVARTAAMIANAIVIDVDADPCCTPRAVTEAMRATITECEARKLTSLRVPLLGTKHGRLDVAASVAAIAAGLSTQSRIQIALVVPTGLARDVRALLGEA